MAISKPPPAKVPQVARFASRGAAQERAQGVRRSILLSLPSELVDQIDDLAKRRFLNRTALVTVLMTEGIERANRNTAP